MVQKSRDDVAEDCARESARNNDHILHTREDAHDVTFVLYHIILCLCILTKY